MALNSRIASPLAAGLIFVASAAAQPEFFLEDLGWEGTYFVNGDGQEGVIQQVDFLGDSASGLPASFTDSIFLSADREDLRAGAFVALESQATAQYLVTHARISASGVVTDNASGINTTASVLNFFLFEPSEPMTVQLTGDVFQRTGDLATLATRVRLRDLAGNTLVDITTAGGFSNSFDLDPGAIYELTISAELDDQTLSQILGGPTFSVTEACLAVTLRVEDAPSPSIDFCAPPTDAGPAPQTTYELQTVALQGDPAPLTDEDSSGATFVSFEPAAIGPDGRIAFVARISGPSVSSANDTVLYTVAPDGALALVVREGDALPGITGGRLVTDIAAGSTFRWDIGGDGTIAFRARSAPPATPTSGQTGMFRWRDGTITPLGIENADDAPVIGGQFSSILLPEVNHAGDVVFASFLVNVPGTGADEGLFRFNADDSVELLRTRREPAPGLSGAAIGLLGGIGLSDAPGFAFRSRLEAITGQPAIPANADEAVWYDDGSGNLSLLFREGSPAPGTAQNFINLGGGLSSNISFNAMGAGVFLGKVNAPSTLDDVIYRFDEFGPQFVLRDGDAAPGFPGRVLNRVAGGLPILTGDGQLITQARLAVGYEGTTPLNDDVLYLGTPGNLTPIVREGDLVPGQAGAVYSGVFSRVAVNESGTLTMIVNPDPGPGGVGIGPFEPTIVVSNTLGELEPIVTIDQPFPIPGSPGDVRTPQFFQIGTLPSIGANGLDTADTHIASDGRIVFGLLFDNATGGVFVARPTSTPPCPGDINNDGIVDTQDLGIILGDFGCVGTPCPGDINNDGISDTQDLGILLGAFGTLCG